MSERTIPESVYLGAGRAREALVVASGDPDRVERYAQGIAAEPSFRAAVESVWAARQPEVDRLAAKVAHYERCIDWDATCKACAAGLDISHELAMRAEQAEEERDRLAADNERLRARVHEAVDECQRRHAKYVSRCAEFEHWSAWARQRFEDQGSRYWSLMSEADRLVIMTIIAERDRLADAIRRYEPVIEAAKVWLLPKGNTVEIDNAHNALEDAIEALGDASEAHPNPYRAASVMPHYPRIAAERTVVEAAKAWRAARPGPWTSGADVEFGLLCAVDALGDVGADPDGEQKIATTPDPDPGD